MLRCYACVQELGQLIAKSKFYRLIEQGLRRRIDIFPVAKERKSNFVQNALQPAARRSRHDSE